MARYCSCIWLYKLLLCIGHVVANQSRCVAFDAKCPLWYCGGAIPLADSQTINEDSPRKHPRTTEGSTPVSQRDQRKKLTREEEAEEARHAVGLRPRGRNMMEGGVKRASRGIMVLTAKSTTLKVDRIG
jgi:hypothetical protein